MLKALSCQLVLSFVYLTISREIHIVNQFMAVTWSSHYVIAFRTLFGIWIVPCFMTSSSLPVAIEVLGIYWCQLGKESLGSLFHHMILLPTRGLSHLLAQQVVDCYCSLQHRSQILNTGCHHNQTSLAALILTRYRGWLHYCNASLIWQLKCHSNNQ